MKKYGNSRSEGVVVKRNGDEIYIFGPKAKRREVTKQILLDWIASEIDDACRESIDDDAACQGVPHE